MKKKADLIVLGCVLCLLLVWGVGTGYAVVTGPCANCHTMHNSQDSADVVGVDPLGALLNATCMGCHSSSAAGDWEDSGGAPIVYNSTQPSYGNNQGLAAGNFHFCDVAATESVFGHNVAMVNTTGVDSEIGTNGPPGFTAAAMPTEFTETVLGTWGPATWADDTQVTCAGGYGCHGNRDDANDSYAGIKGAHHASDASIDGTTIAKSYRFLAGITGVELNSDGFEWERNADATHHNGYQGNATYSSDNTISYLCGQCHGNFHAHTNLGGTGEVGSGSAWLRHPTDVPLDASAAGVFTTDYTAYSTETPVALATPSTSTSTVDNTSIVMCLSCHRAHASPHTDILRFDYSTMNAGDATNDGGCERCHERQR